MGNLNPMSEGISLLWSEALEKQRQGHALSCALVLRFLLRELSAECCLESDQIHDGDSALANLTMLTESLIQSLRAIPFLVCPGDQVQRPSAQEVGLTMELMRLVFEAVGIRDPSVAVPI